MAPTPTTSAPQRQAIDCCSRGKPKVHQAPRNSSQPLHLHDMAQDQREGKGQRQRWCQRRRDTQRWWQRQPPVCRAATAVDVEARTADGDAPQAPRSNRKRGCKSGEGNYSQGKATRGDPAKGGKSKGAGRGRSQTCPQDAQKQGGISADRVDLPLWAAPLVVAREGMRIMQSLASRWAGHYSWQSPQCQPPISSRAWAFCESRACVLLSEDGVHDGCPGRGGEG